MATDNKKSTWKITPGQGSWEVLAELQDIAACMIGFEERFNKLESSLNLLAKPSAPSPLSDSPGYDVRRLPRKGQMAAPTPTPSNSTLTPLPNIKALSSKAAFEKTVVTISIPDEQAGHVIGHGGTGLKQIHDISHAKITFPPLPTGSTGLRTVTIRGTAREVGDAISAIGKRLARRRIRSPKVKEKKVPTVTQPPVASSSPPKLSPVYPTPSPKPLSVIPKGLTSGLKTPLKAPSASEYSVVIPKRSTVEKVSPSTQQVVPTKSIPVTPPERKNSPYEPKKSTVKEVSPPPQQVKPFKPTPSPVVHMEISEPPSPHPGLPGKFVGSPMALDVCTRQEAISFGFCKLCLI
jgi:KH domain